MQYLSKAYNYYSGINPATLSGAIDIIVVRSVDENGDETLAGSPFHVRFGKLQVLRAGEKRVTLRMPNNLPAPHIAPFSMKVSETGEAFFVLETEEEVPEELMTSPVVAAADADDVPPPGDDDFGLPDPSAETSRTQQPFGATEKVVSHEGHADNLSSLPDVEPLDLNAGAGTDGDGAVTLHTPDSQASSRRASMSGRRRRSSEVNRSEAPPNPLEAEPGENTELPIRNWQLKYAMHNADGSLELPKVSKGMYDGPEVMYGKDIVMDGAGYHSSGSDVPSKAIQELRRVASKSQMMASALPPSASTPTSPSMFARPDPPAGATTIQDEHVEELVNDLMASVTPQTDSDELSASIAALSLEDKSRPSNVSPKKARYDRAQTEPPEDMTDRISHPLSPPGERLENQAEMDLAWDWSQYPKGKESKEGKEDKETEDGEDSKADGSPVDNHRQAPQRGESLPVALDNVAQPKPLATLKPLDEDNYTFVLKCEGRVHTFELSLCGTDEYAPEGKATQEERDQFDENRMSFGKFIEDAAIVDDPKLIVKYNGLYLSWKTGYHVLFALAIYGRSMVPPKAQPTVPQRQSGYWSRWWRRAESTGNAIERVQSASGIDVPPKEKLPLPPTSATSPPSEIPSPSTTPVRASVPGTPVEAAEPPAEEKHYAKTLRLSSDQLKQLHLKPGPNTVQFSVTSSYSGNAIVTARIFLWEETDQVIISDIDGTITKSDALGHVFAAIGRDWTHGGIANLYTDIANNGYKMIYLTARAIGQADTTREYLKTIVQGSYRMPEGPVIMSPDRLMASLHREVILRKPELFKMACLRDIQRLFGKYAKTAFFAGFGNRITDAMSYRSVGIGTGKIYTIDSTGVILTELLQTSHRGSYVALNDLVNEMFPPVKTKFQPQFTDFNYWKAPIADIPLPDLAPPSPALSARSDASGASRLSMLGRIATLGRRGSRSPPPDAQSLTSRPTSPLLGPSITADDLEDDEEDDEWSGTPAMTAARIRRDSGSSMPGSFENGNAFPEEWDEESQGSQASKEGEGEHENYEDGEFDDDILATGEMANVPF